MVEERLRAGNLRRPCEDEQQRQQAASGDGYDGGTYGSFSLDDRVLKRFQAKWTPVRVKKTRQNKRVEPGSDSIRTDKARVPGLRGFVGLRKEQGSPTG
jgi:hypothetical protein